MPDPQYVIRRYISLGPTYAVDDCGVRGRVAALQAAEHMAADYVGVAVLDEIGDVVATFGSVPRSG
ncbi:hypothetical protein [Aureimonas leprariae]|uniref:Uncharacterized protein n=1 Tax=Plantimonas leprariae TaxID=2615207 RepID=A0A7V7PQ37_9HYPH|nr:hypothetical protein [Aureimonas leprariae]KAB0680186.1 hypothetical protein F6X38_08325 [Aureimonas leprariae]